MDVPADKSCPKCDAVKPLSEFSWKNKAKGLRQSRCKACMAAGTRDWYSRNAERERRKHLDYHYANREARNAARRDRHDPVRHKNSMLKAVFGITLEQYNEMLERQGGVCAICEGPETVTYKGTLRALSVDHDHATGAVRGLLCGHCNRLLGAADDNIETLRSAIAYLVAAEEANMRLKMAVVS